jgi:superfamily II DNA helicase RecQ
VAERIRRLRRALAEHKTVWGGCPLEPDVLLRLARNPPTDKESLADMPGVGPAVTESLGRTILRALSSECTSDEVGSDDPLFIALSAWRTEVALEMGVPSYRIATTRLLRAIALAKPASPVELARIPGVGPRALAKFTANLLHLVKGW